MFFSIREVTYQRDDDKIKYAQPFLRDTPFNDWSRMAEVLNPSHRTWAYYVDFLQNKLKPQYLREIEVGGLLKKCHQRPGQKVSELVSYIESLEVQLVEVPTESQKHSHLLRSLHDYLKDAIVRSNRQGKIRAELEEAARTAEQTEPMPDSIRNAKKWKAGKAEPPPKASSSYRAHPYRQQHVPASSGKGEQSQSATHQSGGAGSSKGKKPDRGDRPRVDESQAQCWNCGKKGHFERNYPRKAHNAQASTTGNEVGKASS